MPGIVGFVSRQNLNPQLLDAMVAPMLHRPTYRVEKYAKKSYAIATIDLKQNWQNDRTTSQDGRYHLTVYGMIYEDWANRNIGLAEKLLERFSKSGWKGIADLNGEYIVVILDSIEKRLTIVNDRLGLKRLNYWQENGTFAFASEVKSLAALSEVSREINVFGLSELLTFGHLQEDRTLLKDVKLLPMASCLIWEHGKIVIQEYWRYAYFADKAFSDSDKAINAFAHYLSNAVARRVKRYDRLGLFLSGGLDSRTLGGWIRKIRPQGELLTWTGGHGHDHDTRFAKIIAKAIRSQHHPVTIQETFLKDWASYYSWALDGMVSSHGAHRAALMQDAANQCDVIFCGYLGDTVGGDKRLETFAKAKTFDELIDVGYRCFPLGFTDELFKNTLKPSVYRQIQHFAFERYAKVVEGASIEHLADRALVAELNQRQRLWNPICQMDLMEMDTYTAVPFTDKDYIDFALKLPLEQRLYKRVYVEMIKKHLGELARIPRSGEGLPLVHSRLRASLHWRWVLFERNTLPKLTGGKFGGRNYGPFVHCAEWFRNSNRGFIEKTLINNPILAEHFQMDALNNLVRSFLDNTAEHDLMDAIAALMSYALFRQQLDQLSQFRWNFTASEKAGIQLL